MKKKQLVVTFYTLIYILLIWQPLGAHGGGKLYISNQPVGDYFVSVWVNPPQPKSNQGTHITVGVGGKRLEPVLDAQIVVNILDETDQSVVSGYATTEQSVNRLFYETDLPAIGSGDYEIVVDVEGADGAGMVSFPLSIKSAGATSLLYAGLGLVGVITAVFIIRAWRKQNQPVPHPRDNSRT